MLEAKEQTMASRLETVTDQALADDLMRVTHDLMVASRELKVHPDDQITPRSSLTGSALAQRIRRALDESGEGIDIDVDSLVARPEVVEARDTYFKDLVKGIVYGAVFEIKLDEAYSILGQIGDTKLKAVPANDLPVGSGLYRGLEEAGKLPTVTGYIHNHDIHSGNVTIYDGELTHQVNLWRPDKANPAGPLVQHARLEVVPEDI
jgi:hypothetical protein